MNVMAFVRTVDHALGSLSGMARLVAVAAAGLLGVLGGLGSFTFGYGDGLAYLQNDPAACANCHVMQASYDSWLKASHHAVATCNDCHLSHSPIAKWMTKADNGFWHSLHFTTGRFPDPLRIKPRNHDVTERACRKCHQPIVEAIEGPHKGGARTSCVRCHADVGHPL